MWSIPSAKFQGLEYDHVRSNEDVEEPSALQDAMAKSDPWGPNEGQG